MESSTSSISPPSISLRPGRTPGPRLLKNGLILAIRPEGLSISNMSRVTFTASDPQASHPFLLVSHNNYTRGSPPSQEINSPSRLELGISRDVVIVGVLQHSRYFPRSRYRVIFYAVIWFRTLNSSSQLSGWPPTMSELWDPQDLEYKFIVVLVRGFGGYRLRYFFLHPLVQMKGQQPKYAYNLLCQFHDPTDFVIHEN